jgi:hypothetical protein
LGALILPGGGGFFSLLLCYCLGDKVMSSVAVVIPTVNKKSFPLALESVLNSNTKHLIKIYPVYDGREHWSHEADSIPQCCPIYLTQNIGKVNGQSFYGHRAYAMSPHFTNEDYVFFLDEDNQYHQDHIDSLVNLLDRNKQLNFAFSLRRIHSLEPDYYEKIYDNCESLGFYSIWCSPPNQNQYLVDTSSYAFRRSDLICFSYLWHHYGTWGADRAFFQTLKEGGAKYGCTGKHTLEYYLGGNEGSVTKDFFIQGNNYMKQKYGDVFPWQKEIVMT